MRGADIGSNPIRESNSYIVIGESYFNYYILKFFGYFQFNMTSFRVEHNGDEEAKNSIE